MTKVNEACDQFRRLLEEQLARIANMNTEKVDFSKKDQIVIGIIDGDGIGPVIMRQAVRVLNRLLEREINSGKIKILPIEGLTIENRMTQGVSVPADVMKGSKAAMYC